MQCITYIPYIQVFLKALVVSKKTPCLSLGVVQSKRRKTTRFKDISLKMNHMYENGLDKVIFFKIFDFGNNR